MKVAPHMHPGLHVVVPTAELVMFVSITGQWRHSVVPEVAVLGVTCIAMAAGHLPSTDQWVRFAVGKRSRC
jgi:hypothetical protein